ncbi:cluster of Differentiation 80/86 isoform X2 [Stegastes partitus]|uniref:T-lymphocyte activation antigen CD86-like n=1 Tax=Stegastes partitus TaxID=144197 RepID=A0A3B5B2Y6_9TELE|nr:PREDICTED: T-lymphocyte activation antigen CD86-like isoform X1 [Stegastes partitus]XP_008299829.1 PREDICTED: T-lymphocyte activation antigen CD86-like isoform X2 [Stegastes partitus]
MALKGNRQCFLPRIFIQLLALVFTVAAKESAAPILVRGEVGGKVTFRCCVGQQRKPEFMYLQKGKIFVNGCHSSKNIEKTWPNTRVDCNTSEVHMSDLTISHSGDYNFIIQYNKIFTDPVVEEVIRLNVTGNFTRPSVKVVCSNGSRFKSCTATCTSHGGFPFSNMTWNVNGTENTTSNMWKVVNRTKVQSSDTMLFTSTSSANFNCSSREVLAFSCSVRDVTSDEHLVCTHQDPEDHSNLYVIIAACIVVVMVVFVVLWCWKCKQRQMGSAVPQDVMQELRANEDDV